MASEGTAIPSDKQGDDIAIIGLACRFPGGASDASKLWELLSTRKSAFSEVPPSRFNVNSYYHPSPNKLNTLNSRGAHFMQQDVAAFDAPFFSITAQEANAMDPAARMLLEVTFEALENAGQKVEDIAGSDTSCYVGCFTRDYHEMLYRDIESVPMYTGTGTGFSLLSNRISWFYDLHGPSMTLDTACSSSLVGLHLACRGLQARESNMAVVCGANVILSPDIALTLSNLHMLSMDGLSKSFAEGTTGYGRGEGIAGLILKRFDDAIRDGDPVRAIIRGSGVNQDGHTKGITLPNSDAQAELISRVYASANIDPSTTGYFEAHGTGTSVGDPLELAAIAKSISRARKADHKLIVGSIKSNIGHLEGAAGLAGVIKCVLMVERDAILPNIHFDSPNRRIPFDQWRIQVPTTLGPWPTPELRRASINSFGYGGTNAHVIIDDPDSYFRLQKRKAESLNVHSPSPKEQGPSDGHLIVFSARDEAALVRLRQSYHAYIAEVAAGTGAVQSSDEASFLDRFSYTLGCRRSVFPVRSFITTPSLSHLAHELSAPKPSFQKAALSPRVGFVFTGQGAQWARMGCELMRYPVFASSIHEADKYLTQCLHSSWSVVHELENEVGTTRMELAEFSQPLSTILQVALVDLLRSWHIAPTAVVGHSSGEIAAAYTIGAISKIDAWKISYLRGQLCAALPIKAPDVRGSMMAVGLSPEAAQARIDGVMKGKVVVACVNSPSSVTISGDETGIDELLLTLQLENVFARKLRVQNAYHSHHMKLLADDYLAALDGMSTRKPDNGILPIMASSVTGKLITRTELGPDYWVQNLVSPVLFSTAVATLLRQPKTGRRQTRATEAAFDILLEIGPHAALKGPLRQILQAHDASHVPYVPILLRGENGSLTALAAAGTLFCHGVGVDIKAANQSLNQTNILTDLPSYPWNHSLKYWADSRISRARQARRSGRHDLIGAQTQDSDDLEPRWRHFLRVSDNPWIRDHVVHNSILYPGSGILGMPIHALQTLADPSREIDRIELRDVHIVKAVVVPDDQFGLEVFLRLRESRRQNGEGPGWWEFSVCSNQENDHVEEHGYGFGIIHYRAMNSISAASEKSLVAAKFRKSYEEAKAGSTTQISPEAFYTAAKAVGLTYGPSFQGLTQIKAGKGICAWEIHVPDTQKIMPAQAESPHIIHPTTLDIVFHSLFAASGNEAFNLQDAAIPIGLESISVSANLPTGCNAQLYGFSQVTKGMERDIIADIYAADFQADEPGIIIKGLRCRELPSGQAGPESLSVTKAPIGHVVQKVDISLLETSELTKHLSEPSSSSTSSEVDWESTVPVVFDLIAHKNPFASFLQVGSISRNLTKQILSVLGAGGSASRRFRSIKFIDSDSTLIDELASTYAALNTFVHFVHIGPDAPLPVDTDSMDLVLLSAHQLSDSQWSGRRANGTRAVKPGGRLLAITTSTVQRACDSLTDDLATIDASLEFLLQDGTETALYIGTPKTTLPTEIRTSVLLILLPLSPSTEVVALGQAIRGLAEVNRFSVYEVSDLTTVPQLEVAPLVISLLEYSASFLRDISETEFVALKSIVLRCERMYWLATGSDPVMHTASGFLRSLSNENIGTTYCFIHLEDRKSRNASETARLIGKLLLIDHLESEYIEKSGELYCRRWLANDALSLLVGAGGADAGLESFKLSEAHDGLALVLDKGTKASMAVFSTDELASQPLLDREVEVAVTSSLLCTSEGRGHDWQEAVGMVTMADAKSDFPVGAIVSLAYNSRISTKIRILSEYVQAIPLSHDLQALPLWSFKFPTVHHSLCTLAELNSQKTVFIQGGGTILGQLGAALAIELGATVFASVQSEKESLSLQKIGLPVGHLLDANGIYQASFLKHLMGGECGPDIIFNTSGSEDVVAQLWSCMGQGGKFVDVYLTDASTSLNLSVEPFRQGATFSIVNLKDILQKDVHQYRTIREKAISFLASRPSAFVLNIPTFTADRIQQALESVDAGSGRDSAVLLFQQDIAVPVLPEVRNFLRLNPDATYVLAGGLGGLGRSLARLMVDSGARHLVFLSRSGPGSAAANSIMEEFIPRDVKVAVHGCDIADPESIAQAFKAMSDDPSLPHVKGIIQCAAVLRDSIFDNMTYGQWTAALRPKIQGTWNLHQASLSKPCDSEGLDFFVMLASISGFVGNRGQANYAAGNSYQDALAYHRRSLGLAATSVDLGLMQDIGLIAEQGGQSNLKVDTVVPLSAKDFELIFKLVLNSNRRDVPAQIITGLPTGGILQHLGVESSPFYFHDARFTQMQFMGLDESLRGDKDSHDNLASAEERLAAAADTEQASSVMLEILREHIAKTLRCSADDIDATKPLHAYGMDSLTAVDLRAWFLTKLKAEISLFEILGGGSIQLLADKIAKASKLVK